jgi:hypothetical protein
VHDLPWKTLEHTQPGSGADYNPLIGAITECIAKNTWNENGGGTADIRLAGTGLLVISQSRAVHEEIRSLMAAIRKLQSNIGTNEKSTAITPSVRQNSDSVVTRSYLLRLDTTKDNNEARAQVRDLITQSLPDETWNGRLDDGQGVSLVIFSDRIVVHHKQSLQEKLQSVLVDSGLASPIQVAPTAALSPRGALDARLGTSGPGFEGTSGPGMEEASPGPGGRRSKGSSPREAPTEGAASDLDPFR